MEYSQTESIHWSDNQIRGLNPYSNGILTDIMLCYLQSVRIIVLILILMEYSQTKIQKLIKERQHRLNPYSNGILTD